MNTIYGLRSCMPIRCALTPSPLYRFQDLSSSWESFNSAQLPEHFAKGLATFQERIDDLDDPTYTVTTEERHQLFFMLEELLYLRGLLSDVEQKRR